ncbi:hypothetical protein [Halovivax cerinus]|uniref:TAT (Twin-arginine translocation) pathway signal sequence n=1 Tax=Halovivax cerinus TaxID=1487865 RepID=A0ABD5NR53_9EURY|nr:hypothetical protein [Halovivax cerinus]
MAPATRRGFLSTLGSTAGIAGIAGCLSDRLPGGDGSVDRTVYIGAYHWGFILVDEGGAEREQIAVDRGTSIELVAFNTGAEQAFESLPASVRSAVPEHHELEERNEERIPAPNDGDLHEALEAANDRYPDHSVTVVPSGGNHMGSGIRMHPLALPTDTTRPTVDTVTASQRGDYTLSCMTYCGYGHPYMYLDGGLIVR